MELAIARLELEAAVGKRAQWSPGSERKSAKPDLRTTNYGSSSLTRATQARTAGMICGNTARTSSMFIPGRMRGS